jgi:hypothetical protein
LISTGSQIGKNKKNAQGTTVYLYAAVLTILLRKTCTPSTSPD